MLLVTYKCSAIANNVFIMNYLCSYALLVIFHINWRSICL